MALVLGLALGVAVAYAVEYLDDTVKLPDDVTRRLKLPLLGLVPAVAGSKPPVLTGAVPHDFGEAFRSLRTSLVFTNGSPGKRIIAVTSTQPLEGKTTTACNLAVAHRARRIASDAHRRRHAASRPAPDHGHAQRNRPVAHPHGTGARARGRAADEREQPVRDHGRPSSAQSVGAACRRNACSSSSPTWRRDPSTG